VTSNSPDRWSGARLKRAPFTAGRNLTRHPARTGLALLGLAVTTAMLLDMVLLSGGIERSFERLLRGRGFQIRISPKGTLPFDTEASIPGVTRIAAMVRADPAVEAVGPMLGTNLYARRGDSLITLFGYGVDPAAQGLYQMQSGTDLQPSDSFGVLLGAPVVALLGLKVGDMLTLVGRLDPQVAVGAVERRLIVRGTVRWLYDYRGQPSIGTVLPVLQVLSGQRDADRASAMVVKVRNDAQVEAVASRLRGLLPLLEVNSVTDLVRQFRRRLAYFRQLSLVLGGISLAVTLLLVSTLMTITVNERLGEIATLRAIGVSRARIVQQVLVEGALLTLIGSSLGVVLGVLTSRYLDWILTSFPGLPAAISFFVPQPANLAVAGLVLLLSGVLAGAYPALLAARAPIAATLRTEAT